jgi:uncharacterized protein
MDTMTNTTGALQGALKQKVEACQKTLRELGTVLVAFSGGVDSSYLLALAVRTLGAGKVLAAMAVSTIFPQRDARAGRALARELGVELVELSTAHLADPAFTSNPADRCYYCKSRFMSQLKQLAAERGLAAVVSGANADDRGDYRPGARAEVELGIRRPLQDAGLTKAEIREASAAIGLATARQPSLACLATRVPYGEPITREKIARIEAGEEMLLGLGFSQCRVRDHGTVARVEVPADELDDALRQRQEVVRRLKDLGYTYVTLDLEGFRSGSMNQALNLG